MILFEDRAADVRIDHDFILASGSLLRARLIAEEPPV